MDKSCVSHFRKTLFKISRQLSEDELGGLIYLCKDYITVTERESIKKAITLFDLLEKKRIILKDDFTFLIERMDDLQREDLRQQLLEVHVGAEHECGATADKKPQDYKDSRRQGDHAHSQDEPRKPTAAGPTPGNTFSNINSPIFLGNSVGNKIYYGQARASSTPAAQTQHQYTVPNAGGTATSRGVASPLSAGQQHGQNFGQFHPKSRILKTPADFGCEIRQPKTDGMRQDEQDNIHASSCKHQGSGSDPIDRTHASLAPTTNSALLQANMRGTSGNDNSPILDVPEFTRPSQSTTHQKSAQSQTDMKRSGSNDGIPILDWPNVLSPQPSAIHQDDEDSSLMKGVYNPDGTPRNQLTPQREGRESSPTSGAETRIQQSLGEMVPSGVQSHSLKARESSENVAVDDVMKKLGIEQSDEQPESCQDDLETDAPEVLKDKAANASPTATENKDEVSKLSQDSASPEGGAAPQQALMGTSDQASQISGASANVSTTTASDGRGLGEVEGAAEKKGRVHLREYQHELAHCPLATGGNYIICAPTGSGKTLTAASICYQNYLKFQSSAAAQHKHFKALFIVNIRHLKDQQKNAFQEYFPNTLAARTIGEQQSFEYALMKDEPMPVVLMLTAQIVVNALRQKTVTLQDLDMLIFDECHHTILQHPYNVIMKAYLKQKTLLSQEVGEHVRGLPQVIGLSASLGVGRGQSALTHVLNLCANMDVRDVIRVRKHKAQLDEFVKVPEQDAIISVPPRVSRERHFGSLLEEIMSKIEDELGETVKNSLPRHGCQQYETTVIKQQEESPEHGDIVIYMHLNAYNKALMLYEDLPVRDCLKTLEDFHNYRLLSPPDEEETAKEKYCRQLFDSNLEEMKKMATEEGDDSNQKLQKLIELLTNQFTQNPKSKGIVLTRMKVATVALCEFIRSSPRLKEQQRPVKPERLVGQGAFEEHCMTESQQKMVLDDFREEDGCNVLVATDIAQEGLDMPACNFVIRYNFVSNEIGTVQSKGRARAEGSNCFLIVESGSANELREYENRDKVKNMEKAMNDLEGMKEEEKLAKIKQRQEEIVAAILQAERQQQQLAAQMNLEKVILKCAECKTPVCKASDLRRKGAGGFVTCIDPGFMAKVVERELEKTVRYRDTQSVSRIMCGSPMCKMQFGTKEMFFLQTTSEGFSLRAKSFIVQYAMGGEKKLKKWKDLPITEDEDL